MILPPSAPIIPANTITMTIALLFFVFGNILYGLLIGYMIGRQMTSKEVEKILSKFGDKK